MPYFLRNPTQTITFILPRLFNPHCREFHDDQSFSAIEKLIQLLVKSKKTASGDLHHWLAEQFNLPENYQNCAGLMAKTEGLNLSDSGEKRYWLRADPVMLMATHNGILCRGNRLLNLSASERASIESLVNDYLQQLSSKLILVNSSEGYFSINESPDCQFTPLLEVMGQDISRRLPVGNKATYWHQLITDLQMLLHRSDVNKQRISEGLPVISGIWFWAEAEPSAEETRLGNPVPLPSTLFTDHKAILGVNEQFNNLQQLTDQFERSEYGQNSCIYVSEFEDALLQNDQEYWLELFQRWVVHGLLPAMESVKQRKLGSVQLLVGDGYHYQYGSLSNWCFWRNNNVTQSEH